jgi:flagellar basal body-associated protein FliL
VDGGAKQVHNKAMKTHPALLITYRVLLAVAALLALTLVAGSLYALIRGPLPEAPESSGGETVFSGLGQIRAVTSGPSPATVILSIAFPFPPEDRDFSAELSSHTDDFRDSAAAYFSSLSAARLRETPEETIKTELLSRFNSFLLLGRIERVYFSDYMILE